MLDFQDKISLCIFKQTNCFRLCVVYNLKMEFEQESNNFSFSIELSTYNHSSTYSQLRHSLSLTLAFTFMYAFIFTSGVIGNGMVIYVTYRKRRLRTVSNMFILNLAAADLLVMAFCVPATLAANIFKRKYL